MKKKSGKFLAVLSALLIIAGLTACSNLFESNESNSSVQEGAGTVSFRLNTKRVSARTALPTLDFSAYTFTILAKTSSGIEKTLAEGLSSDNLSQKFTLARDLWTFTVQAYTQPSDESESATLVLEGSSQEIDLVKDSKADVDLTLTAATSGSGSLKIPVTYSTDGVGSVTVGVYDKAVDGTLVEGTEKTFTTADGITQNTDGSYSIQYDVSGIPSGKTYYACFVFYDEAGEVASYYTEAVYIVAGETSSPVIYLKNADGSVQTDDEGNPVIDTETTEVTVEPNLFETTVIYEAADTTNGESREIIVKNTTTEKEYTLYDEDGDGVYDNALPPGTYDVVSVKTTSAEGGTETKDISEENISVDISTDVSQNTVVAAKLSEVKVVVSDTGVEVPIVSATLSATALAHDSSILADNLFTIQWYRNAANSKEGATAITGATDLSYTLSAADAEKYVYAEVTQTDKNIAKASTPVLVAKGTIKESALTVKYGSGSSALTITSAAVLEIELVQPEEESTAAAKASLSNSLLSVSGAVDNLSGSTLEAKATFSKTDFTVSGSVDVAITVVGYETITMSGVKVIVKQTKPNLDEIPALVSGEGIEQIKTSCVAFEREDSTLEYAVGTISSETVWKSITIEDFAAVADDVISIRVKAVGSVESSDYVAPSDAVTLTVAEENEGTLQVKMTKVVMSGVAKVGATLTAKAQDDEGELSTLVSYQWLVYDSESESFKTLVDYTDAKTAADTYVIQAGDVGKIIKVRAKQGKGEQNVLDSEESTEAIAKGTLKSYKVLYTEGEETVPVEISAANGITLTHQDGKALVEGSVSVTEAKDELSNASVEAVAAFSTSTEFTYCGSISVKVSAAGYEDAVVVIPVTVKAASPTVPSLRTDKNAMDSGEIAFTTANSSLEYSIDGGTTYSDLSAIPFKKGNASWAVGNTILVRVKATGSAEESNRIEASEPVTVTVGAGNIGSRVLLTSVSISPTSGLKVGATLTASPIPANATDVSSYQWARADSANGNYTNISGAASRTYTITAADAGKFIKVTARQSTSSSTPYAVTASAIEAGTIADDFTLTYDGSAVVVANGISLTLGSEGNASLDGTKLSVSGAKDSISTITLTVAFEGTTTFEHCGNITVKLSALGYNTKTVTIPVRVKASAPEAPALSTSAESISAGAVAFAAASETLEYSVDDGTSWKDVTTTRFYNAENGNWKAGDSILVRVKATGSDEANNHIEVSDSVTVTVTESNLGTKPTVNFGEITYTGDIVLAEPVIDEENHTVTIAVSNASLFTAFEWKKDNVTIDEKTDSSIELDISEWVAGTYQITVVGTHATNASKYSATVPVTKQ